MSLAGQVGLFQIVISCVATTIVMVGLRYVLYSMPQSPPGKMVVVAKSEREAINHPSMPRLGSTIKAIRVMQLTESIWEIEFEWEPPSIPADT